MTRLSVSALPRLRRQDPLTTAREQDGYQASVEPTTPQRRQGSHAPGPPSGLEAAECRRESTDFGRGLSFCSAVY